MKRKQDFLKQKSENSKTVLSKQHKDHFLCNQCEDSFKSKHNLEIHMETMHKKVKSSSDHIEQLDGQIDVSLPSGNSTFKDGFKTPSDKNNKPIEEENDLAHAPTEDGPEIKMIFKTCKI